MDIESIGSVLKKKGREICSVAPDTTVYDALARMAAKNLAAVLVISDGKLVGIVSARDLDAKSFWRGNPQETCECGHYDHFFGHDNSGSLSPRCHVAHESASFSALPVLEEGELEDVVTMSDLMGDVISGQAFTIDQLHTYIGQPPN
jgi:CBS domain-containing protein